MTQTLSYLYTLKNLFSSRALLTLTLMICGLLLGSSTYAFELDSTNIESYGCLTTYTTCNFQGAGISNIEPGTFANHNNLTSLDLSQNYISLIESGTFEGLSSLQTLNLNFNSITFIDSGAFAELEALTSISLVGNQITSIKSVNLFDLLSLQTLDLTFNPITSIKNGDFARLSSLQHLYLGANYDQCYWSLSPISSIESGSFAGLSSLQTLHLVGNTINFIEYGLFSGLSSLQTLDLAGNEIESIENGVFDGLINLMSLNFGPIQGCNIQRFNHIRNIDNIFNGLTNLTNLILSSNQINIINGVFSELSNLTYLNLANNSISSINGVFSELSNLTYLTLENNSISSINGAFNGLTNLTNLILSSNQITSIESGDFAGLSSLQELGLDSNCLNNEDTVLTNYLDGLGLPSLYYYSQYVCVGVQYSPSTSTTSSVTGSLAFFGPTSKVNTLTAENPSLSSYDYVFTDNGSHLYDYSSIIDSNNYLIDSNNYLWDTNFGGGKNIAGSVTWIDTTPPLAPTISAPMSGSVITGDISSGNTLTISGTVENGSLITLTMSGMNYTGTTNMSGVYTIVISTPLGIGNHTASVAATDSAGNISPANMVSFTIVPVPVVLPPVVIIPPVVPRSSGGGGGGSLSIDTCPSGDYSSSYYDKSCGTKPLSTPTPSSSQTGNTTKPIVQTGSKPTLPKPRPITTPSESNPTQDDDNLLSIVIANTTLLQRKSYEWAIQEGITTVETVAQARLDNRVTRAELAKILSIYAMDVMEKIPSDTACEFEDTDQTNKDLLPYVTQVCQLGIMGLQSDGKTPLKRFNPNAFVTRAEFGTVLSRVLYGTTYNSTTTQWRAGHLNNLKQDNFITITDPNLQEQRGWIMTMLYKTVQE